MFITKNNDLKIGNCFTIEDKVTDYIAIELISNKRYRRKSSLIYSLGLIVLEMITLQCTKDFGHQENQNNLHNVLQNVKHLEIQSILTEMLNPDYKTRITRSSIVARLENIQL